MTQNNHEALQNLKAKVPHEADDLTGVGGDETVSEALSKNVFSSYVCTSVNRGVPHPGDIAEPTSLRCSTPVTMMPCLLCLYLTHLAPVAAVLLRCQKPAILYGIAFQQTLSIMGSSVSCSLRGCCMPARSISSSCPVVKVSSQPVLSSDSPCLMLYSAKYSTRHLGSITAVIHT